MYAVQLSEVLGGVGVNVPKCVLGGWSFDTVSYWLLNDLALRFDTLRSLLARLLQSFLYTHSRLTNYVSLLQTCPLYATYSYQRTTTGPTSLVV